MTEIKVDSDRESCPVPQEIRVNCIGETCPVPLVEVRKALRKASPGDIVEVIGTHPASKKEIPMAVDAMHRQPSGACSAHRVKTSDGPADSSPPFCYHHPGSC